MRKLSYIVAIATLSIFLFGCENDRDKIVISYCKALEAGKLDEAASYLSKDAMLTLESAGGNPFLAMAGATFKKHRGIHKIQVTNSTVTGKTAKVDIVYNFNDGFKASDYFPLVNEDGKWKIAQ